MSRAILAAAAVGVTFLVGTSAQAQDWPQWRGPNRDARATGFKSPKEWPKKLTKKWSVTVGDGVSTPALVGDFLYVYARQDGQEVLRCLKADSGKEVWAEKNPSEAVAPPASAFSGPRSSPAVADGKVVVLGVHGSLACFDAAAGKQLWRKDNYKGSAPKYKTSSSPIIIDKLAIAQLGSAKSGAIVAYDLATGKEKWKWTGDGTAYASPAAITVGDVKAVVAETASQLVALSASEGKLLWKTGYQTKYNASSPIVEGDKLIYGGGKGTRAVKFAREGDELKATELWNSTNRSLIYNSPVVREGLVYALSDANRLFCLSMKDGKELWDASLGGGGGKVKGKMGGGAGYGSIIDLGPALLALTPAGELIVFEPSEKEFKQIAKYPVGSRTYAYPIPSGNRIFIKDSDSVTLWVVGE